MAVVFLIASVAFWIFDAFVDAFVFKEIAFTEELIHPPAVETWIRTLFAVLVVLLYASRRTAARLHIMSAALAEAPDGVQIVDLDGKIAYSNRAVEELYGYRADELAGRHVNDMNVDPEFANHVILPHLASTGRWQGELDVKHKDGRAFQIWLTAALVRNRAGRPIASVGVIRDISERKRQAEEMRQYAMELEEATRLKDLFADILRHDLLGPASAMRLSIDALLKRESDPVSSRLLGNAQRSCTRLTELIDGVARYARLSAPQELEFGVLDLGAAIRSVVADFEPQRVEQNARIEFHQHGEYPVRASPVVAEVFANLLSNALKYGPEGGTIAISIRDAGDRWDVSVADSGPGIPDADKEKVFTRFERLRKEGVKGTGVGLAIARRIVELHHGRIWIEDNPGGGSAFHVALSKT